mmetsp:Transcript_9223/g.29367  ORF Transcript_9223/g.29367 Transcript_9223/m.29367 type:complete len:227 (-) Transcript_9223:1227-1907(-)
MLLLPLLPSTDANLAFVVVVPPPATSFGRRRPRLPRELARALLRRPLKRLRLPLNCHASRRRNDLGRVSGRRRKTRRRRLQLPPQPTQRTPRLRLTARRLDGARLRRRSASASVAAAAPASRTVADAWCPRRGWRRRAASGASTCVDVLASLSLPRWCSIPTRASQSTWAVPSTRCTKVTATRSASRLAASSTFSSWPSRTMPSSAQPPSGPSRRLLALPFRATMP